MSTELLEETEEERRLIRESAAGFVESSEGIARVRELRRSLPGFDPAVWTQMAELGWLSMLTSETLGGLGLGMAEMAIALEEVGKGALPEPLVASAVLAAGAIRHGDNVSLQTSLLEQIGTGEVLPCLAHQEDPGDMEGQSIATSAAPGDGGYILTGTKRFLVAAGGADGFVVSAKSPDGIVLAWVAKDAEGLALTTEWLTDGGHFGTLELNDVKIGNDSILASGDVAGAALARATDEARVAVSAELLGLMRHAFEMTLEYLRERKQFDKPIGSFQALQHACADLFMQIEMSRSALDEAVEIFDGEATPRQRAAAASNAKARCTEAALDVTRKAIQLYGAIGYTEECDLSVYVRRVQALGPWLGNATQNRLRYLDTAPDIDSM